MSLAPLMIAIPPFARRARLEVGDEFSDDCVEVSEGAKAEVDLSTQARPGEDIVKFWMEHKSLFPRLHIFFLKICCVPATSAASEREFSAAGFILNNRRTSLTLKFPRSHADRLCTKISARWNKRANFSQFPLI